jgi:hypothetical protein
MNYSKILDNVNGVGIQDFDQGKQAVSERIDIKNGVCRALVVMWLRSKRDNQDFWKGKGSVNESLLAESNRLKKAVDLQAEYARAIQSRYIPDSATLTELEKSNLGYYQNDVTASSQEGFAQTRPNDEPSKISDKVLLAKSRFYILSAKGNNGAHSIGIHRPYSLIGKSSDAYLFDPNIGEFKVSGKSNLKLLLTELNARGYSDSGIDLNKSYILWSFKEN